VLSWVTIKNYGLSDAADLFVFISGYTAAFVFGRIMIERGYLGAAARLVKRALELYAAHIIVVTQGANENLNPERVQTRFGASFG
jgi:hypothetical protein